MEASKGVQASCSAWLKARQSELEEQFTAAPGVTWLQFSEEGIGCSVCAAFGSGLGKASPFQACSITQHSALRLHRLKRHAKSRRHVAAVKAMLEQTGMPSFMDVAADAPPVKEFAKVVAHIRKHPLGREGVPGIAGRNKARIMAWCVADLGRQTLCI